MKTITTLMALATLGLAACSGSSYSSSNTSSSATKTTSAAASGGGYTKSTGTTTTASSSGGSAIKLAMHDNFFGSKTITGKPGSTVKVTLTNEGQNEHNFKIDSQKANADVKPGTTATVSVTIPTSGSVQFYCEYHKGLGMVGTVKPA